MSEALEQARRRGLLMAAPIVPTLVEERGLGYDAKLPLRGEPMFFQFKLSKARFGGRGQFFRQGFASPPYKGHYLQFKMRPEAQHKQHWALRSLAHRYRHVYYAVPDCLEQADFEHAVIAGEMLRWSRLVSVRNCPDIAPNDPGPHHITFQHGRPRPGYKPVNWDAQFHSEPKPVGRAPLAAGILAEIPSRDSHVEFNVAFAELLLRYFSRDMVNRLRDPEYFAKGNIETTMAFDESSTSELLRQAARSLQSQFGIFMALAGPKT